MDTYGDDGFFPMMIMYDGTPEQAQALAEQYDLTYPILMDTGLGVFDRFNPDAETPSTTYIDRGAVVHTIDTTWYPAQLEEILYGTE